MSTFKLSCFWGSLHSDWEQASGVVVIHDNHFYISEAEQSATITAFTETCINSEDDYGNPFAQWEGSIELGGKQRPCVVSVKYFEDGGRNLYIFLENETSIIYYIK